MPVSPVQPVPGNLASTPMAARDNTPAPVPEAAPTAAASSALSAAASAVRVTVDDRPLRPVTPTSMRLYLMRVPLEKLASAYDEIRDLVPDEVARPAAAAVEAAAAPAPAPQGAPDSAVAPSPAPSPAPARADVPPAPRNLLDVKV